MIASKQKEIPLGGEQSLLLATGGIAEQASGAVLVSLKESVVLVTCMVGSTVREGVDFLPLICDFEEKMYAAGKIPGGFIKREGRPSEQAILTSRLMDRPHRPLFPKGFFYDVQLIATPLSFDPSISLDILAVNGASAALALSGAPVQAPIGCVRIGWDGNGFQLNPSFDQLAEGKLDLVLAGTEENLVMVECKAKEVPEEVLLDAFSFARPHIQAIARGIADFKKMYGRPPLELPLYNEENPFEEPLREAFAPLQALYREKLSKPTLDQKIAELQDALKEKLVESEEQEALFKEAFYKTSKQAYREMVLRDGVRVGGRTPKEIRPISCQVGFLPRAHGSGLFTRGETQVLTVTTLGALGEVQLIDGLTLLDSKRFMHQYNFPPYSVGEVRPMRGPGRREVGHGALAEKALENMIPAEEDFPYALRLVSEVISSNGSTSMASTCGSTLSLMDAGVPIRSPVSGIAMGLIQGEGKSVILSDIQGLEDAFGDMDFKVAGTKQGVTALQMDIKVTGLSQDLLYQALLQAKEGRLYILEKMLEVIASPRENLSPHAPRVTTLNIPVDSIGMVIGPGGKNIKKIIEETGAQIDIHDDGTVFITAPTGASAEQAAHIISDMTREIKAGEVYTGLVTRILPFGAIVELCPGKDGMIHISQLALERVEKVEDVLKVGDSVAVKVMGVENGKVQLSRKALLKREPRQK